MILVNLVLPGVEKSPWTTSHGKDCEHHFLGPVERNKYGQCRLCTRAYKRKWNRANTEYGRQWRAESAEELQLKKKAHYDENAEYYRAEQRRRNRENPDKKKASDDAWKKTNPEAWRRAYGMVFRDGHTVQGIAEAQFGRCAICGCLLSELPQRQVHVDHDHAVTDGSPNVRGVLCAAHNHLLGNAQDRIDILESAIAYLRRGVL